MFDDGKYVLVTGGHGQLGSDIVKELNKRNIKNLCVGSSDLDIRDINAVSSFFDNHSISYVIHCAAYTKVDLAETEKNLNYDVNVKGTANIVSQCLKYDIPLVFFSTDYVFGGEGDKAFKEDEKTNPLCEYAKSKYKAEKEVKKLKKYFILRISWVFGKNGNNFINTMIKLSKSKTELNIVSDQIGSPTYTVDVASETVDIINTDKYGIYHLTNEGYVSWADFAREIFKKINKDIIVNDITSEEYNAKAIRPKNSRLDKTKLIAAGFKKMPTWQDALDRYLKEIGVV